MWFGVIPQVAPVILSQLLCYRECNTPSSTVIGALVVRGIGLRLTQAIITQEDGEDVSYYIILIIGMVMATYGFSASLRREFFKGRRPHDAEVERTWALRPSRQLASWGWSHDRLRHRLADFRALAAQAFPEKHEGRPAQPQPSGVIVKATRSPANQLIPYSTGRPPASTLTASVLRIGAPSATFRSPARGPRAVFAVTRVEARV